ncbi:MAG: hypothetical protein NTX25_18400 [Proteobacteria bacterium]|nr:hypothetical protein [Pseudomonadota bacterium]
MDEEWLTLDQARGALLALRIILPSLEEIPEVESAYSFSVKRDPLTGLPNFVSMKPLSSETAHAESLHVSSASYDGVINDDTSLVELIENANIAEDDRELLGEVLSEAVFALADEQCGIIFDVKAFCDKIAALAAAHKSADNQDTLVSETKH